MSPVIILLLFISYCNSTSIGVSEQNLTNNEDNHEFFPDWVPFKNKHGEQLGEFLDVKKTKPKKRLAQPLNFILRAVAEEGDDYYDKAQGETDNEDYFEKKDWTDLNRMPDISPSNVPNPEFSVRHNNINNIITKPSDNPSATNLKSMYNKEKKIEPLDTNNGSEDANDKDEEFIDNNKKSKDLYQIVDYSEQINNKKEKENPNVDNLSSELEDDDDDDETSDAETTSTKKNLKNDTISEEERKAEEAKKIRILNSVDELKERHANEQRIISEKVKQEELFREQHDRDRFDPSDVDSKYSPYGRSRWKNVQITDEYDDDSIGLDKYKIKPYIALTTTRTTTKRPTKTTKKKENKKITIATGKLSVFRNPHLYMIDEDDDVITTIRSIVTKKPKRFSARYTMSSSPKPDDDEGDVRISLVPQDVDFHDGEPKLFFPRKTKNKRRLKATTTTAPDFEDKTEVTYGSTEPLLYKTTSTVDKDTSPSGSEPFSSISNTAPSASDAEPSAADTAQSTLQTHPTGPDVATTASGDSDLTHASSDTSTNKEAKDYHKEKGGGNQHDAESEEEHEEHSKKAYEAEHKDTKTKKGHHDKEKHNDEYDDHGGVDKHHHDEDSHFGEHHHEEEGKKHAEYEESGKHSKGHSTKGSHDIHKKEEYEKKEEFFEEDGDSGEEEKHGGHRNEHGHSKGDHFRKENLQAGHKQHEKGAKGQLTKGAHGHHLKGQSGSGGHDGHGKHGREHFRKDRSEAAKNWVYHHGYPAKNANLVIIDRRHDGYQHGPRYYG